MRPPPTYPLIFLHLPKTAGTTLNGILRRHFPQNSRYPLRSASFHNDVATLKGASENSRRRIQLLHGHQPFGLHVCLAPGARYLTVLRDPVARVVSHYHYVKKTRHPKFINAIQHSNLSLADYAASGISGELENGQTRWVAGIWDDRPLIESDLGRAIENIEKHFDWVGLTEHFDESLMDLALKYRWARIYYRKRNVASPAQSTDVSTEALEIIAKHNQLDLKLYAYVKQRFDDVALSRKLARRIGAGLLQTGNWLGERLRPGTGD